MTVFKRKVTHIVTVFVGRIKIGEVHCVGSKEFQEAVDILEDKKLSYAVRRL